MELLFSFDAWVSLLTLTFLETVLGIDNIIFISIVANKLPENKRSKATNIGLVFAAVQRILLLFLISYLIGLKEPFYVLDTSWVVIQFNTQSVILFLGGLFLLYKSIIEIYQKITHRESKPLTKHKKTTTLLFNAILQILLIDFIFSIDSILTAVGMVSGVSDSKNHSLIIMSTAVIISVGIMIFFANSIRKLIDKYPSLQILALSFLILIGVLLISEAAHSSHTTIFGNTMEKTIPKGYLYFAIGFALFVEIINIQISKSIKKKAKPSE